MPCHRKFVLVCLVDNADEFGHAWPSQQLIARKTSISVRRCRDHLHTLESQGWISTVKVGVGRGQTAEYAINVERIKEAADQTRAIIRQQKADVVAQRGTGRPPFDQEKEDKVSGSAAIKADVVAEKEDVVAEKEDAASGRTLIEPLLTLNESSVPPPKIPTEIPRPKLSKKGTETLEENGRLEDSPPAAPKIPRLKSPAKAPREPPTVSPEFRQQMRDRWGPVLGLETIDDRIKEALNHSAAKKCANMEIYVNGWLRRDADQSVARRANGHQPREPDNFQKLRILENATKPLRPPIHP